MGEEMGQGRSGTVCSTAFNAEAGQPCHRRVQEAASETSRTHAMARTGGDAKVVDGEV